MIPSLQLDLVTLPVPPGVEAENQSGLQLGNPKIYRALAHREGNRSAAHRDAPDQQLHGPLPARANGTRGHRSARPQLSLCRERQHADHGAGDPGPWCRGAVLRERGYAKVFLIGNSGGAALMAFYQSQAEHLTLSTTPAGDPVSLAPEQLPPADGVAIAAGHLGRPRLLTGLIDPSVIDEADAVSADPALNMYDERITRPFVPEFIERYRAAQQARMHNITDRVRRRLAFIRSNGIANDEAFIVYRTYADPRYIDSTLDTNDRRPVSNHRGARSAQDELWPEHLGSILYPDILAQPVVARQRFQGTCGSGAHARTTPPARVYGGHIGIPECSEGVVRRR